MKILIKIFVAMLLVSGIAFSVSADCTPSELNSSESISSAIGDCLKDSALVQTEGKLDAGEKDGGLAIKIKAWTKSISQILGLLAIGSIVYGAFMMVISTGEEEKIKKGKDIIKWGIIGFLGILLASQIITLVTNFITNIAA